MNLPSFGHASGHAALNSMGRFTNKFSGVNTQQII